MANWDPPQIPEQEPRLRDPDAPTPISWGRAAGVVLVAVAAIATGILFADATGSDPVRAAHAGIWPLVLLVTILLICSSVLGLWE